MLEKFENNIPSGETLPLYSLKSPSEQIPLSVVKLLRLSASQMHLRDLVSNKDWHFDMEKRLLKPGDVYDVNPMALQFDPEITPLQDTFDSIDDALLYGLWTHYSHDIEVFSKWAVDPDFSEDTKKGAAELVILFKKIVALIDHIRSDSKSENRKELEIELKKLIDELEEESDEISNQ